MDAPQITLILISMEITAVKQLKKSLREAFNLKFKMELVMVSTLISIVLAAKMTNLHLALYQVDVQTVRFEYTLLI